MNGIMYYKYILINFKAGYDLPTITSGVRIKLSLLNPGPRFFE